MSYDIATHIIYSDDGKRENWKRLKKVGKVKGKEGGKLKNDRMIHIVNEHETLLLDDNERSIDIRGTIVYRIILLFSGNEGSPGESSHDSSFGMPLINLVPREPARRGSQLVS